MIFEAGRPAAIHQRMEWTFDRVPRDQGLIALLAAIFLLHATFAPTLFGDGDTSWHLAAGRLILATWSVPHADPFSYTYAGKPWIAHEWLSEVFMAAAFQAGSWQGLSLLFGSAAAALALVLGLELRRWLRPPQLVMALLLAAILLKPFVLARPHVLAWPLLAGWTILLLRAREKGRAPPLPAALLMLFWANLHASFVFGLILTGVFALEALIEERDRRQAFFGWARFGAVALLASLLTPHGVHGLLFPLIVSSMESLPLITEWQPTQLSRQPGFMLLLLGMLFLAFRKTIRIPVVRLILLVALLFLAFQHVRHQALLGIVGVLLVAKPLGETFGRPELPARSSGQLPMPLFLLLIAVFGAAALFRSAVAYERQDSTNNPVTAIRNIPAGLRDRPVLNTYGFGGPLILEGIKPHIDGRADMYGDAFMFETQEIMRGDEEAFRKGVEHWGIQWTILSPDAELVLMLDQDSGWRRIYADDIAVIHVAKGAMADINARAPEGIDD